MSVFDDDWGDDDWGEPGVAAPQPVLSQAETELAEMKAAMIRLKATAKAKIKEARQGVADMQPRELRAPIPWAFLGFVVFTLFLIGWTAHNNGLFDSWGGSAAVNPDQIEYPEAESTSWIMDLDRAYAHARAKVWAKVADKKFEDFGALIDYQESELNKAKAEAYAEYATLLSETLNGDQYTHQRKTEFFQKVADDSKW